MRKTSTNKKTAYLLGLATFFVLVGVVFIRSFSPPKFPNLSKPNEESFQAPGRDWPSEKKVEDYFVEKLRMTPVEVKKNKIKARK